MFFDHMDEIHETAQVEDRYIDLYESKAQVMREEVATLMKNDLRHRDREAHLGGAQMLRKLAGRLRGK